MQTIRHRQYKYFSLLTAIAVTSMIIATILPYKILKIGNFIAPGGVFAFPLFYFLGDVITEVYGYKLARQMIWITVICLVFYSLMVAFIIRFPSPPFWQLESAYKTVLGSSMRVLIGFLVGIFLSNFSNIYAISHWKILMRGKLFWLRSIGASAVGEAVFSIITGAIVYLGVISFHDYLHLTACVWFFKIIYASIAAYPATLLVAFLKKAEDSDTYDYQVNFNPFKFSADENT